MTHFDPLATSRDLIVYLDIKSPYAFIAWQPTVRWARRLGLSVDWRPLTLDIPSYLGSARVDEQGNVLEQNRSDEQWAWVRHAYKDARRYAALDGLTLRGTVKIWDTSLAHIGFMWAKHHDQAADESSSDSSLQRYLGETYPPFWRRELDVEDPAVIESLLDDAGVPIAGFRRFLDGEGRVEHYAMQAQIFDAGIYGVPSYVVGGELFFGREHLPRVCWLASGGSGPAPDVAYCSSSAPESTPRLPAQPVLSESLAVGIDFTEPQCLLALRPLRELAAELGVTIDWQPFVGQPRELVRELPARNGPQLPASPSSGTLPGG